MLKFFCSSLHVAIQEQQISLSHQAARYRRRASAGEARSFPLDMTLDVIDLRRQWDAAFAGMESKTRFLQIILEDALVKYFLLMPPANARSIKDFHAAALMRFETLFGVASEDWLISADWQVDKPSLVCAVPRMQFEKINEVTRKSAQHIVSLQPRFVWAWNQCQQKISDSSWFASVGQRTMTLAALQAGNLQMVKTILFPEIHDETWLHAQLQRETILYQLTMPEQLMLLGEVPSAWKCSTLHQTNLYQIAQKNLTDKVLAPMRQASADMGVKV